MHHSSLNFNLKYIKLIVLYNDTKLLSTLELFLSGRTNFNFPRNIVRDTS